MATDRRTYSAEFKVKVVLELISGQKGLMQASREYQIKDTVLSRWKQEFLERAPSVFQGNVPDETLKKQLAETERILGRKTMELEMAKKVLSFSDSTSREREK
jgi:transposase-like protein